MNLRQMEIFVNVVRHGNFSNAAKKMFLTQPAVSSSMDALEKELDTKLFYFQSRRIQLTDAGKRFLDGAVSVLGLTEQTIRSVKEGNALEGMIRIATHLIPGVLLLPDLIKAFREQNPQIMFEIGVHDLGQTVREVVQGQYDIGLIGAPVRNDSLEQRCVFRDRLVLVAPNCAPYTDLGNAVDPEMLLKLPFVSRNLNNNTVTLVDHALIQRNLNPADMNVVAECNSSEVMIELTAAGLGVCIYSASLISERSDLLCLNIRDMEIWRSYYAVYQNTGYLHPRVTEFLRLLPEIESEVADPLGERSLDL